ncbi:hypothetical protein DRO26_01315 [Candidatus Bathyarchaeota archaeon]|nr:MAG: hypothetical protein DRO26_01315 [Candidatus Bathyarchaeota archaeon]
MEIKTVLEEMTKGKSAIDLVKFDEKTSKLNIAGITIAPFHDYFLPSILVALEKQLGPVARTLFLRYAKEVGLRDGQTLRNLTFKDGNFTVEEAKKVIVNFIKMWCSLGWGKLVKAEFTDGYACFIRSTSYEGEGYLKLKPEKGLKLGEDFIRGEEYSQTPKCTIALGYVMGVIGGVLQKNVNGKETECIGNGGKFCRFEIRW